MKRVLGDKRRLQNDCGREAMLLRGSGCLRMFTGIFSSISLHSLSYDIKAHEVN